MVLIKYASNTLCLQTFSGVLLMVAHEDLWVGISLKCLASSDLLFWSWFSTNALAKNSHSGKDTTFNSLNS